MRYLIILIIGLAAGYMYGFNDAQDHDKPIVTRMVDQIGGRTRDKVKTDADRQIEQVERR